MTLPPDTDWSVVWAGSGAATLSGRAGAPPLDVPQGLVRSATDASLRIAAASARLGRAVEIDGPALLGERAAIMGLGRRGDISCGGGTRLLRTADDWIAISLARESDRAVVPAWLGATFDPDDSQVDLWASVQAAVAGRRSAELIERAVLLGMPISRLGEVGPQSAVVRRRRVGERAPIASIADLVVVDLSSLWAGPLCAQLLGTSGMRVVKVESEQRPDGARQGPAEFFDLLHGGHESVCIDFRDATDVAALRRLLGRADVVIEASRPRALEQLGIVAAEITAEPDGPRAWLSITGHGRDGETGNRIGFGDDAAVAGGLVTHDADGPCFCADAVADPLTGMFAAAAVFETLAEGDNWLLDTSLAGMAASAAGGPSTSLGPRALAAPRSRPVNRVATPLGHDTSAVLTELA